MPDITHLLKTAEGITTDRMNEREDYSYRESIWSVSRPNLNLYSTLFPAFWLAGTIYLVVFVLKPWNDPAQALPTLLMYIGSMGISSAVLSLMIVAGKDFVMVLFDWANKARAKARREGREEGREEGLREGYKEGYAAALAELKREAGTGDSERNGGSGEDNLPDNEGQGPSRRP